ncbi:MAG: ice-binding family protein [Bacilli bacterium]
MKNKTPKTKIYLMAVTALLSTVTISGVAVAATSSTTVTAPALGAASTFGLLGQTISNSDPTFVSGDVGFGSGGETSPPTITNGSSYPNDAAYNNAELALGSVISSANSQTPTSTGNLDISGQTLHPGVYAFPGAGNIQATPALTLSGAGVYIFQITGAFNTVAGTVITLANGATPCDVFWVVGGATTLGANTTFEGTIMSAAAITVGANSTVNGRILSETATMISTDHITVPPCATGTTVTGSTYGTVTGSTYPTGSTPSTPTITSPTPPTVTPPATVTTVTPPATVTTVTPPATVTTVTPPATVTTVTPPATVTTVTPPATVTTVTPPATVTTVTPPVTVTTVTPPVTVTTVKPPVVTKTKKQAVTTVKAPVVTPVTLKITSVVAKKPTVVKHSQSSVAGATSPVTGIPAAWELAEGFAVMAFGGLMTVLFRRRRRQ